MKDFLIGLIIFIIISLSILFNYSEKKYTYNCEQESINGKIELSMKITEYKWWIFWSDSGGYMNIEIPNKKIDYFEKLDINGDNILIYKGGNIIGRFSKLTNYLYLESNYLPFDGKCLVK